MRKLVRLTIAIGGFLIVTSLILTGTVFLALLNIIDLEVITNQTTAYLLTLMFMAIAVADFVAGIILMLKR